MKKINNNLKILYERLANSQYVDFLEPFTEVVDTNLALAQISPEYGDTIRNIIKYMNKIINKISRTEGGGVGRYFTS